MQPDTTNKVLAEPAASTLGFTLKMEAACSSETLQNYLTYYTAKYPTKQLIFIVTAVKTKHFTYLLSI
jgi:hypothetical protein